ncbi:MULTISPECIES: lactococcin 972 family bacteriocin [unclassified Streptomyces]|uniref:lactococcin 972 family bacteriocin n=1 Tax=unclassified Streptomyces TaxID=2593676 RepID=UPI003255C324
MKKFAKSIALGFAGLALAVSGSTMSSAAEAPEATGNPYNATIEYHTRGDGTQPPAELGDPKEWGVAEFEMDPTVIRPQVEACTNPDSGGKWCYGWYLTGAAATDKYCYSNYAHQTKTHKSSVNIANVTVSSGWVSKGSTSNAHRTTGAAYTCKTYYATK